jgi:hypothetical protein
LSLLSKRPVSGDRNGARPAGCRPALQRIRRSARTADDKTALERQIDATDRQIDGLVYELYGLTDEEIKLVEEATAP